MYLKNAVFTYLVSITFLINGITYLIMNTNFWSVSEMVLSNNDW